MAISIERSKLSTDLVSRIRSNLTFNYKSHSRYEAKNPKEPIVFFTIKPKLINSVEVSVKSETSTATSTPDEKTEYLVRLPYYFGRQHLPSDILAKTMDLEQPRAAIKFTGTLRSKQVPVSLEATKHLLTYGCTTLGVYPGFGKTILGAEKASQLGYVTLVLAHREVIIKAWKTTFTTVTDAKIWVVGEEPPAEANIIICMDTRVKTLPDSLKKLVGLLIVDEAHCFCTPTHVEMLLDFTPRYVIAETATWKRKDGMHVMLQALVGQHGIFIENDNPFDVIRMNTAIVPEIKQNRTGDLDWSVFTKSLALNPYRNSLIVNLITTNPQFKILVLTIMKDQAALLCDKLRSLGESVDYMSGKKKTYNDSRILIGTRSKIGTGFDEQNACEDYKGIRINLLIVTWSTNDEAVLAQNVGRVLRADAPKVIHLVDQHKKCAEDHWKVQVAWYKRCCGTVYEIGAPVVPLIFPLSTK